ncbi:MAG: hypothetical protein WCA95_14945 [Opitutaceae bacterium]
MNPDINPAGSSSSPAPVTAPTTPAAQAATPTSPALQARPRFNRGNKKQQPQQQQQSSAAPTQTPFVKR